MAYDKVVDSSVLDAGLTQIADAIRGKSGTSDSLSFPTGMAEAIAAIQGDGNTPFYENIQYTGEALYIDDGDGNWRVKFLTSGTLTVKNDIVVDLFAVGGGGNGGTGKADYYTVPSSASNAGDIYGQGGAGGGGGYTTTVKGTALPAGTYTVTIGAAAGKSSIVSEDAATTYCTANGGKSGSAGTADYVNGGSGGSGGGGGGYAGSGGGDGGFDGSYGEFTNGSDDESTTTHKGQGTTTREFGEDTGDLYSGGGGGAKWFKAATNATTYGSGGTGGAGGGGNGGKNGTLATKGEANTGGGGGGGAGIASYTTRGAGGTGIVIIRNVRVITEG